jgi:hypothetical protein
MHREGNSKFLLYIEPKASEKLKEPIDDDLVKMMEMALSKSVKGSGHYSSLSDMGDGYDFKRTNGNIMRVPSFAKGGRYMGVHRTECGERSDSCDFLLENGMITNSLAPFYLKWYRYSIPETEMKKVHELAEFYKTKNPL